MIIEKKSSTNKSGLRTTGGFLQLNDCSLIEIMGKDAERFLHSQTTNDVRSLAFNQGHQNALLDRKAHIVATFDLYRGAEENLYYILAAKAHAQSILEHLDKFRFADKVDFEIRSGAFIAIQGPRARRLLIVASGSMKSAEALTKAFSKINLFDTSALIFSKSMAGEEGYIVFVETEKAQEFLKHLSAAANDFDIIPITETELEKARIEAGIPHFGVDISGSNLMPETGLDETHVSYTKGCFQGQEILARVKTYGAPSRGMVGLIFETPPAEPLKPGSEALLDAQPTAWIYSNCFSDTLNKHVAIAYIKRENRIVGKTFDFEIAGKIYTAQVSLLPFFTPPAAKERAVKLYEEALAEFAKEKDNAENSHAELLLKEALMLEPSFEDAYEALGVILSRKDRLDEAIVLMKNLAELNEDSVMAHANLSVFYMQQDKKEEAEEEKAISMSIRMRMLAKEASKETKADEEKKRLKEEAVGRMEMFAQVLEIDDADLLANSGMGNCLVTLENYEKSVPYLRKAIEVKPLHTVAYVDLAKAYAGLNNTSEAEAILQQGIEVASKRGDMMPLKQMQAQLAELKSKVEAKGI